MDTFKERLIMDIQNEYDQQRFLGNYRSAAYERLTYEERKVVRKYHKILAEERGRHLRELENQLKEQEKKVEEITTKRKLMELLMS